ncbi:DUF6094 domain-containing protein [Lentibacillus salinarum]|uniref:DUF6094 domain-containing protein n=1 Tax=Lentibacillus salinarum TaxID=446820 RepID=A0ABW3ZXJ3_9BACI
MARLASESKGGYYPTPIDEVKRINERLTLTGHEPVNLIDPCCGTGEALGIINQHLRAGGADTQSYGVELEESRAFDAAIELDHVIRDGYERVRTDPHYSLLYLNPPYQDGFTERVETTFLRNLTGRHRNILQPDGLLVYIIPQNVLKDASGVLSARFSDLNVYRFTDDNYSRFHQVVLFGRNQRPDVETKKKNLKWLKDIAKGDKDTLLTLDEEDGITYELFPSEPVELFRSGKLNDYELAKDLATSEIFDETKRVFNNSSFDISFERPILELKPMHYSVATMADTDRGGNMGDHFLVSDVVKKKSEKENTDDEGNVTNEEITEHYQSRVRVFSKQGVFDLE